MHYDASGVSPSEFKFGSLVTLYSIFADNHGKRAKAIERVKNDKPNLNSLGV
jgi:hypothetical protein